MKEKIYYIDINNWFYGRDYPPILYIQEHLQDFSNDTWCKEQKICVVSYNVDMSVSWAITAPESWVKDHCPQFLTNDCYEYRSIIRYMGEETEKSYTKWYNAFLRKPDIFGDAYSRFGVEFLEYKEENFGSVCVEFPDISEDES